jgi:hypothetical protein
MAKGGFLMELVKACLLANSVLATLIHSVAGMVAGSIRRQEGGMFG